MLQSLRGLAETWVAKILFLVLLGGFGIWGIGDIFRSGSDTVTVATIGKQKIAAPQVEQAFQEQIQRLAQQTGKAMPQATAKALGLMDKALDQLIDQAVITRAIVDAGLRPTDEAVADAIRADANFAGPDKKFDRAKFTQALAAANVDEGRYVAFMRRRVAEEILISSVTAGATLPRSEAEALWRFRAQTRGAEYVVLDPAKVKGAFPEPTPAQLAEFHAKHAVTFTAPELRSFAYVLLGPEAMDVPALSDAELRQAYDARVADYAVGERRRLEEVVTDTEAQATQVATLARAGKSLADAARAAGGAKLAAIDLGLNQAADLPPVLAQPTFAAAANAIVGPVKTDLGWTVLHVIDIVAPGTRSFDEVHDALAKQLREERQADKLAERANTLDTRLAGGAPVEEAAAALGLPTGKVENSDATGKTLAGTPAPGLPEEDAVELLRAAFEAKPDDPAILTTLPDGRYMAVRLLGSTPPALKPLEAIKPAVAAAWLDDQRRQAVQAQAADLAAKLRAGAKLADLAKQAGLKLETFGPTPRTTLPDGVAAAALMAPVFSAAKPDDVVTGSTGGQEVVGRLTQIVAPDPANGKDAIDRIVKQQADQVRNDLFTAYLAALRRHYDVEINQSVLARLKSSPET